jgi:erythronate-4-phosphate dehydrogenase
MTPILNDPPLKRETGDDKYRPLEELYVCDFITLHTPLTRRGQDKTFHLVDSRFLDKLKNGAVLFNTSRGAVVETAALKQAVEGGKLSAVCLDVWENEPQIDTELLEMVDTGTPHIAGYSFDGKVRGMVMIYNAVCEYFDIEKRASESDFLPEPENKELRIENCSNIQQAVLEVVNKIYNVCEDDKNLREVLKLKDDSIADFFKKLRKEYPVRREFHNSKVKIVCSGDKRQSELKSVISGLGFSV